MWEEVGRGKKKTLGGCGGRGKKGKGTSSNFKVISNTSLCNWPESQRTIITRLF